MNSPNSRFGSWTNLSWWNFLVVLPWFIGFMWLLFSGISQRVVAERQQLVEGLVTAYEPANHNQYRYVFFVDGKSYSGLESPKGRALAVGQKVTVYYDPRDPATNALTEFGDLSIETFGPIPTLLFGIGVVAFFIWRARRKNGLSQSRVGP